VDSVDSNKEIIGKSESHSDPTEAAAAAKKDFVIPEISVPVDVLEATTFFQLTDSGSTT
jgi:hypothetical protein